MYLGKKVSDEIKNDICLEFYNNKTISEIALKFSISNYFASKIIKEKYGDSLINIKSLIKKEKINDAQIQCIYGSLLGDSSLSKKVSKNGFISFVFACSHCDNQKDFLMKKADILKVTAHSYIKSENSWSPGSLYWKVNYHNKLFLKEVYEKCFIDERKSITKEWLSILNWEGIAYWFMDDGCSHKYKNATTVQTNFSTLSFTNSEIDLLIEKFQTLGIGTHKVKSQHGNGIVLTIDSKYNNIFMQNIEPYMASCMSYKIKKDEKEWKK